jgi:hypothetical protein
MGSAEGRPPQADAGSLRACPELAEGKVDRSDGGAVETLDKVGGDGRPDMSGYSAPLGAFRKDYTP